MEQEPDELRVKIVIPSWLQSLSNQLKALWVFFPGVIFLILGYFIFVKLSQGQDIIYQSTDKPAPWLTGIYVVLAILFWVFTTWYTARLLGYDRKDLYKEAPDLVGYFPRFLAYIIFFVLWAATLTIDGDSTVKKIIFWIATFIDIAIFWAMHHFIETPLIKVPPGGRTVRALSAVRMAAYMIIVISCALIIVGWGYKQVHVLLYTLPFIQVGFLYVLIIRRPLYVSRENKGRLPGRTGLWGRYVHWAFKTAFDGFDFRFERPYFITYHILALLAVLSYAMGINYLPFARGLTSFPLVMLCFGVLLGAINVISLVSHRYKINISFLILVLTLLGSWAFETHRARTICIAKENAAVLHAPRENFRRYLDNWISWHKKELDTAADKSYPVFFVLADGGASRSGYWVASVLSALHEGTLYKGKRDSSYFMRHLFCLSGASGGSVGNASFLAAYAAQRKDSSLRTDTLSRHFLANDFLVFTLARMLGPELIKPIFGFVSSWGDRAAALEEGMERPEIGNEQMADMMQHSFLDLVPDSINQFPLLVINSTRVNDCGPAAVSTFDIDSSKDVFGMRIDIINLLDTGKGIRLSTAMVLGARFPYLSPAGKVGTNSYFVDGGYFDNSGTGIVQEMILELQRLKKDTGSLGKIVSKLDFYVMHLSNSPYTDSMKRKSDKINPVVNDLASPILTLAGSFVSQTSINDARLTNYLKSLSRPDTAYVLFNLYDPGDSSISMNWVISGKARHKMDDALTRRTGLWMLIDRMKAEGKKENLFSGLPELKNSVP